jgi:hypothetical protein
LSTQKPTQGRILRVLVRPDDNAGVDTAPAMVTSVNDDDTVNLTVFTELDLMPVRRLYGVQVFASRGAAEKELTKHVDDLPKRKGEPDPGPLDATPWIKVAYWPDTTAPAKSTSTKQGEGGGKTDTPPAS